MATFTEWMGLGSGDSRMGSLAALALGAAVAWGAPHADAAHAATGGRGVSGVRVTLGEEGREWTLVPTLLDGKVESFLALREGAPMGENLTAVWYRKVAAADGTASWESRAFTDQDRSKAVRAVKEALSLADSTDDSWPVAVAEVAAAGPERLVKGVLETDALAPLVAELADPEPIVEMLEDAGWKTAWVGPLEAVAPGLDPSTVEPETGGCPQAVVLDALASGVDASASGGADFEAVASAHLLAECGFCIPWTRTTAGPTCTGCTVAGWVLTTGLPETSLLHCAILCWYETTLNCTWTRTRTRTRYDCTTCTWTETGTTSETIKSKSTTYFVGPTGCNLPAPGTFVCPANPDNPDPGCGSPHQTQRPGGWIALPPGPCPHLP
jgi:hypothetical protein